MENLLIKGPVRLLGTISIDGSKNAALPLLAASILVEQSLVLSNIPHLKDVTSMLELLGYLGVRFTVDESMNLEICSKNMSRYKVPYELMKTMRASILVMGPLLARFGKAQISMPGGCAIGSRPVDLHFKALEKMGVFIEMSDGYVNLSAPEGLKGADITFETVTVTGTENIIMAAVLARGTTTLKNVAKEPEVLDLIQCLTSMGAKIHGEGTDKLVIEGVKSLVGRQYKIIPDRIEAATFLIAATMTQGRVRLNNVIPGHLEAVIEKLIEAGASIEIGEDWILLEMQGRPKAVDVVTGVYPEFATDVQAQWVALNAIAKGSATVEETVFESRFMHVEELKRLGANLEVVGSKVLSKGSETLSAAPMMATDLRASASLVLAGLVARGQTTIESIFHIDRGYAFIEEKLSRLGVDVSRVQVRSCANPKDKVT
jgi:UDP-N-acetylglucosamine 1-carboxyvinyltransferase